MKELNIQSVWSLLSLTFWHQIFYSKGIGCPGWKSGLKRSKQLQQMKKYNTWLTAKNADYVRIIVGLVRPFVRYLVTFINGIKAQTAVTYLNLTSYPPLPPLSHRKDIQRERAGEGLSQVRPRVDSDPLSAQWFWEVWHLSCPRLPPSVGTATRKLGMDWTCSMPSWNVFAWILGPWVYASVKRMLSGGFLALSDPSASKFYFPAFLESIKKVWVNPEFIERAGAVEMLAKNWNVQVWWPNMGSTA